MILYFFKKFEGCAALLLQVGWTSSVARCELWVTGCGLWVGSKNDFMSVKKFEDLTIWVDSRIINQEIWTIMINTDLYSDYALKNQINKSSGSIMDNIAEGFDRNGNKEFIYFLSISKASCAELQSQLYRCLDRSYIEKEKFNDLVDSTSTLSKRIGALMTYLKNSNRKGSKFD